MPAYLSSEAHSLLKSVSYLLSPIPFASVHACSYHTFLRSSVPVLSSQYLHFWVHFVSSCGSHSFPNDAVAAKGGCQTIGERPRGERGDQGTQMVQVHQLEEAWCKANPTKLSPHSFRQAVHWQLWGEVDQNSSLQFSGRKPRRPWLRFQGVLFLSASCSSSSRDIGYSMSLRWSPKL